ncbi:MAG: TIGR01459 family HAD-type hydrolase [Pseudomonadota bacterium]
MTRLIDSIAEVAADYDALFVDVWGVLHDGVRAFPDACAALSGFRKGGGLVILVTNSPRPRLGVAEQLASLGVSETAYDSIATSGDSARLALYHGAVGHRVHHIGLEQHGFFTPLHIDTTAETISIVPLTEAEGLVVTGPTDPHAPPSAHEGELLYAKTRGWKLLCANPDLVVDRGGQREYCAGAIAALYTEMGGESLYFGKPHPPIYDLARRRLADAAQGRVIEDSRILAIGDGPATDLRGALGEGLDTVFITGGLCAQETGTGIAPAGQPDLARAVKVLDAQQVAATFALGYLR